MYSNVRTLQYFEMFTSHDVAAIFLTSHQSEILHSLTFTKALCFVLG